MLIRKLVLTFIVSFVALTIFSPPSAYSQVEQFSSKQYVATGLPLLRGLCLGDLDNDFDNDLICVNASRNEIIWYENIDGTGEFVLPRIICDSIGSGPKIICDDIDGDGDNDIMLFSRDIYWLENQDGSGIFNLPQVVPIIRDNFSDIVLVDIDLDGDKDIVATDPDTDNIYIIGNRDGDGDFRYQTYIDCDFVPYYIFASDIDGDHDPDLCVTSGDTSNLVVWYENDLVENQFNTHHVFSGDYSECYHPRCYDLDGDDDNDIITSNGDGELFWFENEDGLGGFGQKNIIDTVFYVSDIIVSDMDNDNDMDIVIASDTAKCYENLDGNGTFSAPMIFAQDISGFKCIDVSDIDNDNDNDIIVGGRNIKLTDLLWIENSDGAGNFDIEHNLYNYDCNSGKIHSADIDSDGDNDIITYPLNSDVFWFEYLEDEGNFGAQHLLTEDVFSPVFINSGDINTDNYVDIIIFDENTRQLVWFDNTYGSGVFESPQLITDTQSEMNNFYCGDMDGDEDLDIVYGTNGNNHEIYWLENYAGTGSYTISHLVGTVNDLNWISAADFDNDSDMDIVAAANSGVLWYENTDSLGTIWELHTVGDSQFQCNQLSVCDMDMDGDQDIVTQEAVYHTLRWYENLDGAGTFSDNIIFHSIINPSGVYTPDFDYDGDPDILCGNIDIISWLRNNDGHGRDFEVRDTFLDLSDELMWEIQYFYPADIDGDSDIDIIYTDNEGDIVWYRNLSPDFPPEPFHLLLPEDEAIVSDDSVFFDWEDAPDQDDNVILYLVYVSTDPNSVYDSLYDSCEVSEFNFPFEENFTFYWTVKAHDAHHYEMWAYEVFSFAYPESGLDKKATDLIPDKFGIQHIYPNPFNPETVITLAIPATISTKVSIFNILGQEVAVLQDGVLKAGYHNFTFSGQGLAGGCYFVKASTVNGDIAMKKMVLLK